MASSEVRPLTGARYVSADEATGIECLGGPHDGGYLCNEDSLGVPARVLKALWGWPLVHDLASGIEAARGPMMLYYATDAAYPRGAAVLGAYVFHDARQRYEWIEGG